MPTCPYCDTEKRAVKNHVRLSSGNGHGEYGAYPDDFGENVGGDRESDPNGNEPTPEKAETSESEPTPDTSPQEEQTDMVTVEVAEKAIETAREEGYQNGFEEGYDAGYADAREENEAPSDATGGNVDDLPCGHERIDLNKYEAGTKIKCDTCGKVYPLV